MAYTCFMEGNIGGALIALALGLLIQWFVFFILDNGSGYGHGGGRSGHGGGFGDESCPYCGSGDTDGNHCYTCNEDF